MATKLDQLRLQDSQRVDRGDMEFLAATPMEGMKSIVSDFVMGQVQYPGDVGPGTQGRPKTRILGGFALELKNPPGTDNLLMVRRGTALLAARDASGQPTFGVVCGVGDDSKTLDLSSFSSGTYSVWLRFDLTPGEFANRAFWDPLAAKEYTQNIPTRNVAGWSLTTVAGGGSAVAPGAEWTYLGDVVKSGGPLVVTPKRQFFFEGNETASYTQPWGSANDRNDNRSIYGLRDLYSFSSATLQKIEELQGTAWWRVPAEPLTSKVSKNGDNLNGSYTFSGGNVYFTATSPVYFQSQVRSTGFDLATAASPFGSAYVDVLYTSNGIQRNTTSGSATQNIGALAYPFANIYAQSLDVRGTSDPMLAVGHATKPTLKLFDLDTPANYASIFVNTASGVPHFGLASSGTVKRIALMPDNNPTGGATIAHDVDGGDGNPYFFPLLAASGANGIRLGSSFLRWHSIYALNVDADFLFPKSGISTVGSSSDRWSNIYSNAASVAGRVTAQQVYPDADASSGRKLGDSTNRWVSCDVVTGNFYTSLLVNGPGAGFTLGAGTSHAGANGQINVPTVFSDPAGIRTSKIRNTGDYPIDVYANGPNFTDPIIYWQQDLVNGTIWKFKYNAGAAPPLNLANPPGVGDAIIERTSGYALKCQVWDGSSFVDVWLLAYKGSHVPG